MESKKALLTGACGMDATFLAELLHSKGYEIYGIVRLHTHIDRIKKLERLVPGIRIFRAEVKNKEEIKRIIRWIKPDEIYNFAGYSNVFNAYEDMDEVIAINMLLPKNLLEIICEVDKSIKFFQASSCLIFGNNEDGVQNELTPINPVHPYAIAKYGAQALVKMFREDKGLFACSAVYYPHESHRRGEGFFTKKVTSAVARIKLGSKEKLKLGDLSQMRDWVHSSDAVRAAYMMLQNHTPIDYVVGSGILTKTETFVQKCFNFIERDYKQYVDYDQSLHREVDHKILKADATKIAKELGWIPTYDVNEIIRMMISQEINHLETRK